MRLLAPMHGRSHLPEGSDPIDFSRFIRYVFENVGEWLYVETTADIPTAIVNIAGGASIVLKPDYSASHPDVAIVLPGDDDFGDSYDGGFSVLTTADTTVGSPSIYDEMFAVDAGLSEIRFGWARSSGQATNMKFDTGGADFFVDMDTGDVTWSMDSSTWLVGNPSVAAFAIATGGVFEIRSHTGAVKLRWTEGTNDLHIPTGGTIVADL